MKSKTIAITLLLLISITPSPSSEGNQEILSKADALQMELFALKGESAGVPLEEMERASGWIEDFRQQLDSGNEERARITLQKASFQIKLLRALADEARVKEEKEKLNSLLNEITSQTEEIRKVNSEVIREINALEKK
ncbi:MAG TPA: hypothetical protein VLB01_01505 [Thermodesulfobacteriota bacterium]|nr:hypothetical protein [Thermodesulfobacteriota bacterium]